MRPESESVRVALPKPCQPVIAKLLDKDVQFVVVGAYALFQVSGQRPTEDIDCFIGTEPDNIERVRSALVELGFQETANHLTTAPDSFVRIGRSPFIVDLINSISGLGFDEVRSRATPMSVDFSTKPVYFMSVEDIRVNKVASGRPKDLEDLKKLPSE
jgi:predicted nucleotidyltransferase